MIYFIRNTANGRVKADAYAFADAYAAADAYVAPALRAKCLECLDAMLEAQ